MPSLIRPQSFGDEMNKARLLKLAALLESDARNKRGLKFDLGPILRKFDDKEGIPTWDCGSTGCALGLWAVSKQFDGVSLVRRFGGSYWPVYKYVTGRNAAEIYFGISSRISEWLFLASHYDGPTKGARGERAVAKRIRDFVAGKAVP